LAVAGGGRRNHFLPHAQPLTEDEVSEISEVDSQVTSEHPESAFARQSVLRHVQGLLLTDPEEVDSFDFSTWSWWSHEAPRRLPRSSSWWFGHEPEATTGIIPIQPGAEYYRNPKLEWRTLLTRLGPEYKVVHIASSSQAGRTLRKYAELDSPRLISHQMLRLPGRGVVLSLRDFVENTLAQLMVAPNGNLPLAKRLSVLDNVLEALEVLHGAGLVHGDLRPENIAMGPKGAAIFDYGLRHPLELMTPEQAVYVAPEARNAEAKTASDIFSFGKLAQRLLGPYLWDSRELPGGLQSDQLEWILDFATVADPDERPTAAQIRTLFTESRPHGERPVVQSAIRAAAKLATASLADSATTFEVERAVASAVDALHSRLSRFEETQLAFYSRKRAARLLKWIVIDSNPDLSHNRAQQNSGKKNVAHLERHPQSFPESIDLVWQDRIHRLYFGQPIPLDGDTNEQLVKPESARAKRRESYLAQVALASRIRRAMLERDTYLHSGEVAAQMSRNSTVAVADIAALRRWGDILAVADHGRWLYPAFQFDDHGLPRPEIAQVNRRFGEDDRWDVLSWWHLPLTDLGGGRLMEVIDTPEGQKLFKERLDLIPE
jgi:serine/threonine protein kinase